MILIQKVKDFVAKFIIKQSDNEREIEKIFEDYVSSHRDKRQVVRNLIKMKGDDKTESVNWLISDAIDFDLADENSEEEINAWKSIIELLRLEFETMYKKYILLQDLQDNLMSWFSAIKSNEDEEVFKKQNTLRLEALENIVKRDGKNFSVDDLELVGKIYTLICQKLVLSS